MTARRAVAAMLKPVGVLDPHIDRFVMARAGEKKVLEIHKHWIVMVWPVVDIVLGIGLTVWALSLPGNWFWLVWFFGFVLGLNGTFRALDEYRDRFMISTIRLGWFHGVLSTQRAFIPIQKVLDVTVLRPWLGRWLNYGHFKFESAAQIQGLYRISYVKSIDEVQEILMMLIVAGELSSHQPELTGDDGT
jgi:PH (Pleckstrin Homology) domain-containing protein